MRLYLCVLVPVTLYCCMLHLEVDSPIYRFNVKTHPYVTDFPYVRDRSTFVIFRYNRTRPYICERSPVGIRRVKLFVLRVGVLKYHGCRFKRFAGALARAQIMETSSSSYYFSDTASTPDNSSGGAHA